MKLICIGRAEDRAQAKTKYFAGCASSDAMTESQMLYVLTESTGLKFAWYHVLWCLPVCNSHAPGAGNPLAGRMPHYVSF